MPAMSHGVGVQNGMKEVGTACVSGRVSLIPITHPLTQVVLTSPHSQTSASFAIDTTARVYLTCPQLSGEAGGLIG
jgi:hypothetical protein